MRTLAGCLASGVLVLQFASPPLSVADQLTRPSPSLTADQWVTTQIQAQYFRDPEIKARTITILTLNGIVTLEGDVNTSEEATRAVEIVRNVNGVRDVVSHLTIAGEPQPARTSGEIGVSAPGDQAIPGGQDLEIPLSETSMLAQIRSAPSADPVLKALDIDVQVEQGS